MYREGQRECVCVWIERDWWVREVGVVDDDEQKPRRSWEWTKLRYERHVLATRKNFLNVYWASPEVCGFVCREWGVIGCLCFGTGLQCLVMEGSWRREVWCPCSVISTEEDRGYTRYNERLRRFIIVSAWHNNTTLHLRSPCDLSGCFRVCSNLPRDGGFSFYNSCRERMVSVKGRLIRQVEGLTLLS